MNKALLNQIPHFKTIKVPRYLLTNIQECALNHLKLKDMGQLRDRMEGQFYYERLRNDLLAEFSFESLIFNEPFDWSKRMEKKFKRKLYTFNNLKLALITFSSNDLPQVYLKDDVNFYVFVYVIPPNKLLISGVIERNCLLNECNDKNNDFSFINDFSKTAYFSNLEDLMNIMNSQL